METDVASRSRDVRLEFNYCLVGIFSFCPTLIFVSDNPFADWIALTEVWNSEASLPNVSPDFTV